MFRKYLFNNIKEKKSRFILVCLTIGIISALLYILLTSNDVVEREARKSLTSEYGETNIIVKSNEEEKNYFITDEVSDSDIKELIKLCRLNASIDYDDVNYDLNIIGIDDEDLGKIVDYKEESRITVDAQDMPIVISEYASEKLDLKKGDIAELTIYGKEYKFCVTAIAKNEGFFYNESGTMKMLVNRKKLCDLLDLENDTNLEYISLVDDDEEKINTVIDKLEDKYEELDFKMVNSSMLSDTLNSNLKIPLLIILIVGSVISILIIYTTTNVVTMERIPCIGTFLSVGLSMNHIIVSLVIESLIQGAIGGALGFGVGMYAARILITGIPTSFTEFITGVEFNLGYGIISFLFASLLASISAFAAIKKIKKFSIKEIVLNLTGSVTKHYSIVNIIVRVSIPFIFLITGIIMKDTIVGNILIIITIILFVLLLLNVLLQFISDYVLKMFRNKFSYFYIGNKNVCTISMLINNMKLVIITLALIAFIGTVSTSVIGGFNKLLTDFHADVTIYLDGKVPEVHKYLEEDDKIDKLYNINVLENIKVKNSSFQISNVQGVEWDKYGDYNTYFTYIGGKKILKDLKDPDRNIILSKSLLDKFEKKIGDCIELEDKDGKWVTYKITGSVNAKLAYVGSVALISLENAKKDFADDFTNAVCIKLKDGYDIDEYYVELKNSSCSKEIAGITVDYIKNKNDLAMTKTFLNIIESISFIAIILSVVGILNNNLICFMQRRKTFATLDSIGMSNSGKKRIMIHEGITSSFICVVVSFLAYIAIIANVQGILNYIGVYIELQCDLKTFAIYALFIVIELVFSNLFIIGRINKMSIANELKYE